MSEVLCLFLVVWSPSSRRAWIEIALRPGKLSTDGVALLAEGVDRNSLSRTSSIGMLASPSSRRAWIEIDAGKENTQPETVALLAEGVDRNQSCRFCSLFTPRRPPRGGRG